MTPQHEITDTSTQTTELVSFNPERFTELGAGLAEAEQLFVDQLAVTSLADMVRMGRGNFGAELKVYTERYIGRVAHLHFAGSRPDLGLTHALFLLGRAPDAELETHVPYCIAQANDMFGDM